MRAGRTALTCSPWLLPSLRAAASSSSCPEEAADELKASLHGSDAGTSEQEHVSLAPGEKKKAVGMPELWETVSQRVLLLIPFLP